VRFSWDICYRQLFGLIDTSHITSIAVSPEVLDKHVGVYSNPEALVKFTVTRDGMTLLFQPGAQSSIPLEATAQDKFKNDAARLVLEFDAAKNQMTIKRGGGERVFTKEK
jgi:D-alanyl-D-alanine carboxypeptidase